MTDWVEYCDQLLIDNGLAGWRTTISAGKRTIGLCDYSTKTIKLSKHHLGSDDEDYIKDTIIHEVAHALNPYNRHGSKWRSTAKSLGGTGEQYAKHSNYPSKWSMMCANGHESRLFRWGMDRVYSCKCGGLYYIRRSDGTKVTYPASYVSWFNRLATDRKSPLIDSQGMLRP